MAKKLNRRNLVILLVLSAALVLVLVALLLYRSNREQRFEGLLGEARALEDQGKLEEAVIQIRRAADMNWENPEAALMLARLQRKRKKYPEALKAYERAAKLMPENPEVIFPMAELQQAMGRYAELRGTAETLIRVAPEDPHGYEYRAQCDVRVGDLTGAATALEKALRMNPDRVETVVELARVYIAMGDLDAAAQLFKQVDQVVTPTPALILAKANLAEAKDRKDQALSLYREAGDAKDADVRVRMESLLARERLGEVKEAAEGLRALVAEFPGEERAKLALSELEMRRGHVDEALKALQQIGEQDKALYAEALTRIVELELNRRNIEEARKCLKKLESRGLNKNVLRYLQARTLLVEGKNREARQLLEKVVGAGRASALVRYFLGMAYLETGLNSQALEQFLAIGDELDNRPTACRRMCMAFLRLGQFDSVIARCKALLEKADDPESHLLLGMAYLGAGEFRKAESELARAASYDQTRLRALISLARVALQTGNTPRARVLADQILVNHPEDVEAMLVKAEADFRDGDRAEAVAQFESLMQRFPENLRIRLVYAGLFADSDPEKTFGTLEKALQGPDSTPVEKRTVAAFYRKTGRIDDAIRVARLALEQDSEDINTARLLFDLLMLKEDTDAADALLKQLPDSGEFRSFRSLARARIDILRGHYDLAKRQLQTHLEKYPDDTDAKHFLGLALLRQGRTDDAIVTFDDILAKHPARLSTKILLARAFEQNGEWLRADDLAGKILKELPNDDRALAIRASAQTALGRTRQALKTYRALYKIRPAVPQYRVGLARMLLLSGHAAEALGLIRQWRKEEPPADMEVVLVALEADALFALGRSQEAIETTRAAYEKGGRDFRLGLVLAGAYARTDRLEQANQTVADVVEKTPDRINVLRAAARYYMDLGQYDRAWTLLDGKRSVWKDDMGAALDYSRAGVASGKTEEVSRFLERLSVKHPDNARVSVLMGLLRMSQRKYSEALPYLFEASRQDSNSAVVRYDLARCYLGMGDAETAERELSLALAVDPKLMVARALQVDVLRANGKLDQATALAKGILADNPGREDIHRRLCELLASTGSTSAAQRRLSEAKQRFSRSVWPYLVTASLYRMNRTPDRAQTELETGLAKFPNSILLLGELALTMMDRGRGAEAVARVRQFAEQHRDEYGAQLLLAQVLESSGDLDGATRAFKKLTERFPKDFRSYAHLGGFYARHGAFDDAVDAYRRGLDAFPKSMTLLLGLVDVQMKAGRQDGADATYRRILEADPQSVLAMNNLAWNLAQKEMNLDEALRLALKAVEIEPNNLYIQDTLGYVMLKRGESTEAEKIFQNAIDRGAKAPIFYYHLALALAARKARADAIENLEQALAIEEPFEFRDEAEHLLGRLKKGLSP